MGTPPPPRAVLALHRPFWRPKGPAGEQRSHLDGGCSGAGRPCAATQLSLPTGPCAFGWAARVRGQPHHLQTDPQRRPAGVHIHRNLESSKTKDPKQAIQEQNLHTHASIQPSTSKGAKKVPPHLMQADVSADKLAKKKKLIPKIIVTGPSEEVLLNSLTDELPDTRTIRDSEDYGPYTVHSKPSTIDAYKSVTEEEEK